MECATHCTGFELERKTRHGALHEAINRFFQQQKRVAHAVGNRDNFVLKSSPLIGWYPELSAPGTVNEVMHPAKGLIVVGASLRIPGPLITIPSPRLDPIDAVSRHPIPLVIDRSELAMWSHPQAVRGTEPAGDHFELRAVMRDAHQRAVMRMRSG